jgi:hypothetical protein
MLAISHAELDGVDVGGDAPGFIAGEQPLCKRLR